MDFQVPQYFYSETSSDDDFALDSIESSDADDEIETEVKPSGLNLPSLSSSDKGSKIYSCIEADDYSDRGRKNLLLKLFNRERTGFLSSNFLGHTHEKAFNKVPNRLKFCLRDVVPYCYLQGHMFMGLTVCGQFLLSYKVHYDEGSISVNAYNFTSYYKYTLYFWIYRPHQSLSKFFRLCLFDDHGVDHPKDVTITQWTHNPRVVVIHGAANDENEDSYITIARVPKLGCLDCKQLRDQDAADGYAGFSPALCIKCNLTIHTKYSTTESDPKFNPRTTLICPERIVFIANGFIHMLQMELEFPKSEPLQHQQLTAAGVYPTHPIAQLQARSLEKTEEKVTGLTQKEFVEKNETETGCDNKNNIVARIIADFTEFETEAMASGSCEKGCCDCSVQCDSRNKNYYNELIFTCGSSSKTLSSVAVCGSNARGGSGSSTSVPPETISKVRLINQSGRKNHRIVTTKSSNSTTMVDLHSSSPAETQNNASAYDFAEDNENCEKIGTFRKRRLADKKYEFSEDNSENIVPFMKIRNSGRFNRLISRPAAPTAGHPHFGNGVGAIYLQGSSSQSYETTSHLHRSSPSQGFRSPCGSPVGNTRYMRSPQSNRAAQTFYQKSPPPLSPSHRQGNINLLSPRQVYQTKLVYCDIGTVSPTTATASPFLSPRGEDSLAGAAMMNSDALEKPACTKKFKRCFVEEDDAASVITSEEDDCISPGYHTSLPVEVHGSSYSLMQMISQTSYRKLKCPTVIITQHSFDLETFTYHVINNLCRENRKTYDVFYDWASELVSVCPSSRSITCILMAHFTARDQLVGNAKQCINCSRGIDCVFHRKQFECRILFKWDMDSGDWEVVDYGQLREVAILLPNANKRNPESLAKIARNLAADLSVALDKVHRFDHNLRVLDSNIDKSKTRIRDDLNMIEFYRGSDEIIG